MPLRVAAQRGHSEAGSTPEDDATGPDFDLRAELTAAYTSNLYHVTREHIDEFETRDATGDRFHGMKGPDDVWVSPELHTALGWDLGDKRDLELSLAAEYVAHVRNSIANYARMGAGVAWDASRDDALALEAELVPTRFKKNYPAQEVLDTTIYGRADYLDFAVELTYARAFGKRWSGELVYGFETIGFDAPFTNRNSDEHALTTLAAVEVGSRVELASGMRAAIASAPGLMEFGVEVDRSRYELEPIAMFELNLPSRFEVELHGSYRIRNYTTDVTADDTYFDRVDRKLDLELEVSKGFGKTWTVAIESSWTHNDADRIDAQDDPDVVDYDEIIVGAGLEAALQ